MAHPDSSILIDAPTSTFVGTIPFSVLEDHTLNCLNAKGIDGEEFAKHVQKGFLKQYVDGPTFKLLLGNKVGQMYKN